MKCEYGLERGAQQYIMWLCGERISCICFMHPRRFFVYFPPQAEKGKVPVLYYLSGLTCTDENFTQKVCLDCNVVGWIYAQCMFHHLSTCSCV